MVEEIYFSLAQGIVKNMVELETFLLATSFIQSFKVIKTNLFGFALNPSQRGCLMIFIWSRFFGWYLKDETEIEQLNFLIEEKNQTCLFNDRPTLQFWVIYSTEFI